jgi:predicted HNH restriction endonuclease
MRRRWLLRERGHACEVCRLSEWCGVKVPIELHHRDGNAENNAKENLQLVCPNCHAQTPTYKAKNRGRSTRTTRRDRIAA